jgi:hypothetical protein
MNKRLLIAISFITVASSCWANCESGGYIIHTVAEYGVPEGLSFYPYTYIKGVLNLNFSLSSKDSNNIVNHINANLDNPEKFVRVRHRQEECRLRLQNKIEIISGGISYYNETSSFSLCLKNDQTIAERGYARYDYKKQVLTLPSSLTIKTVEYDRSEEQVIVQKIFDLRLKGDESLESRITRDDVSKIDFFSTRVGSGDDALEVITVVLNLINIERIFSSQIMSSDKLREKSAQFPVIFFKRKGETPKYVADGSWCASYRLMQKVERNVQSLGPVERFEIQSAYDFDNDGSADILVINRVAYLLMKNGTIKVIDYPRGC